MNRIQEIIASCNNEYLVRILNNRLCKALLYIYELDNMDKEQIFELEQIIKGSVDEDIICPTDEEFRELTGIDKHIPRID